MSTQAPNEKYGLSELDSSAAVAVPAPIALRSVQTAARTLSWLDRLTLAAIGLIVVLVTLPVLRGFGLRENERDALRMLRVLASEPAAAGRFQADREDPSRGARQKSLAELAALDSNLRRRLEDLELRTDGTLRRHGYLFDLTELEPGEPMLRAWPWEHAQTGRGAFVWTPRRGLLGHRNSSGDFSGIDAAPRAEQVRAGADWVAVTRR